MNNPGSKAIQVNHLTKKFGNFTAVDQISFEVKRGEIFGFLGPNGSGKTTTIRMLLGLLPATNGTIDVLGVSVNEKPHLIRKRVGYMSQRFSLYNDLTVWQNLTFYGRSYGLLNRELHNRMQYAIEMADLKGREKQKTKELSGGWRQRLALGAAILHKPELIFLDEPTAGVDPLSRRAFWDLLYQLVSDKITVFVTTHYMDEAEHCHDLALIQNGKIIARGSPQSIKQDSFEGSLLEIACEDPGKAIEALQQAQKQGQLDFRQATLYGALIHVQVGESEERNLQSKINTLKKYLEKSGFAAVQISIIEVSLEDVFINKMRSAAQEV